MAWEVGEGRVQRLCVLGASRFLGQKEKKGIIEKEMNGEKFDWERIE